MHFFVICKQTLIPHIPAMTFAAILLFVGTLGLSVWASFRVKRVYQFAPASLPNRKE
jgi:hypothetical protein